MKIKMVLIKKQCINNDGTLFDAPNAGNHISELLDFKFCWGHGSRPPKGKGAVRPL